MSKTTFSGPIRTGKNRGYPTGNTIGVLPAVQSVVVSAGAKKGFIAVPPNSAMLDVITILDAAVAGSAASYSIRVGVSADEDQYATMSVSAKSVYRATTGASGVSWRNLGTQDANIVTVDATVATSTAGAFSGIVHIVYLQGE